MKFQISERRSQDTGLGEPAKCKSRSSIEETWGTPLSEKSFFIIIVCLYWSCVLFPCFGFRRFSFSSHPPWLVHLCVCASPDFSNPRILHMLESYDSSSKFILWHQNPHLEKGTEKKEFVYLNIGGDWKYLGVGRSIREVNNSQQLRRWRKSLSGC